MFTFYLIQDVATNEFYSTERALEGYKEAFDKDLSTAVSFSNYPDAEHFIETDDTFHEVARGKNVKIVKIFKVS